MNWNGSNAVNTEALKVPIPAIVTPELLASLGADKDQVAIFAAEWPAGTPLSAASLRRAAALGFELVNFPETILTPHAWRTYVDATAPAGQAFLEATTTAWQEYVEATTPARKAYDEATTTACQAYDEAAATARKAYAEATTTAWKAYREAAATARKAYERATAPARQAYQQAKATVLITILGLDHPGDSE